MNAQNLMLETLTDSVEQELANLKVRFEQERHARLSAEHAASVGLEELYAKQRDHQLMEAIAIAANQANTLLEILPLVLGQICRFGNWSVGHAYLSNPKNPDQLLPSQIWYSSESTDYENFKTVTAQTTFNRGQGMPGRVLAAGEATWAVELIADPQHARRSAALDCGLVSAMAFPIMVGHTVAAVLEFLNTSPTEPTPAQIALLAQVGEQLGRVLMRQTANEQLHYDAFHDSLTGLPNRTLFLDRLQRANNRRLRHPEYNFAVLFVGLDRFKVINDSLGHLAGDQLIHQIADRLRITLRNEDTIVWDHVGSGSDTLARMGGDEFTLLVDDIRELDDAMRIGERLIEVLSDPFVIEQQEVHASASVGVATPTDQGTTDDLLRNANLAMYRAKSMGGARCEFYDHSMHTKAHNRLLIENELRRALINKQFLLHYQPIVSFKTGAIVGLEALIRWQRKSSQLVYPNDFIYIAEDSGLIAQIDMWVLEQACITLQAWHVEFANQPLTVSVNLSARLFEQEDLAERVQQIMTRTGISPSSVRLEITESMTMRDTERAITVMQKLKAMGVHLSIDDFGTGYSSLSYLHRFPADVLKIDRSFVSRMSESPECFQIVNSIMSLAKNLGMDVIAEGPETSTHVRQLQALDCDYGQGYFFSKPVDAAAIHALLADPQRYAFT
jgi:diguanylate cyclase (GGDEF)-like protein